MRLYFKSAAGGLLAALLLSPLGFAPRIAGAQLINPYVNLFGMVLAHPVSVETNMTWNAVTHPGEWIAAIAGGLSDLSNINDPTNPNRYIAETGASNDCRSFGDCRPHPYISSVDGDPSTTTYFFVNTAYVIGNVQYKYEVLNVGFKQHAAFFSYGNPIIRVQIGNTVTSAGHNSYNYGAMGYESPTSTRISAPILFQNARFQYPTGSWDIFCPSYTGSTGVSGAVLMPCTQNPNGGTFSIVPGVRIFTPVVIRQ